ELEQEEWRAGRVASVGQRVGGGLADRWLRIDEKLGHEQRVLWVAEPRQGEGGPRAHACGGVYWRPPGFLLLHVADAQQEWVGVCGLPEVQRLQEGELGATAWVGSHRILEEAVEGGAEIGVESLQRLFPDDGRCLGRDQSRALLQGGGQLLPRFRGGGVGG